METFKKQLIWDTFQTGTRELESRYSFWYDTSINNQTDDLPVPSL